MKYPVTEHVLKTKRHTTTYFACGAPEAPLIIFLHGWPELAISWRHQLPVFAELGFLCVAPDLRGYGGSTIYHQQADYALEYGVRDMLELLDRSEEKRPSGSGTMWVVWSRGPSRAITRSAAMVLPACAYPICPTASRRRI
jgi:pimeloyl-ACP methyl ester carboxylesterase